MSDAKHLTILAGAWLAAVLLWAPKSMASPEIPQQVADQLGMPCTPTCLLCHRDLQGGIGTLNNAFGVIAKANNILVDVPAALTAIEMTMPPVDSDADGTADIAELRAGTDPNDPDPGGGKVCGGGPTYGCGAHIARDTAVDSAALTAALGAAFALVLMRRRG